MNNFLVFIIGLYLILCPFYLFESGLPQPADFVAAVGLSVFIFSGGFKKLFKHRSVQYLSGFIIIAIIVNTTYAVVFTSKGIENLFYLPIAYYIFNFLFFLMIVDVLQQVDAPKSSNIIILCLIFSLILQVVLAVVGVDKETQYSVTGRTVIFFNNPNQLGYYALLMLLIFTALTSKFKENRAAVFAVLAMVITLAVFSSSRIVLITMIFPICLLLFSSESQLKPKHWILLSLILVIAIPLVLNTDFIQKRIELIEIRNHRQDSTSISEIQIRGYDRILNHPEVLLYGAGEGNYDRFNSYQKGEIHSGFGTVLFSYGILGLLFLLFFFYAILRPRLWYSILLLLPVLAYNVIHQGFRESLFWMLLAIVMVTNRAQLKEGKKDSMVNL